MSEKQLELSLNDANQRIKSIFEQFKRDNYHDKEFYIRKNIQGLYLTSRVYQSQEVDWTTIAYITQEQAEYLHKEHNVPYWLNTHALIV